MERRDTFAFLLGQWRLERSIEDHRSGRAGTFSGRATVVELPTERTSDPRARFAGARSARYEESGTLQMHDVETPAHRRLDVVRLASRAVQLRFCDGRPFISLDLRHGAWQGVHQCGADRYEIDTAVSNEGVVTERWFVRGPDKRYDAVSVLTRIE